MDIKALIIETLVLIILFTFVTLRVAKDPLNVVYDMPQKIIDRCTRKIESLEILAGGEFPEELKELFTDKGGLFPSPKEISFNCTCPDWAMMCKHVAAVMYGIGLRFDENPFYFFKLRGIDPDRFIDVAVENRVEKMLANADVRPDNRRCGSHGSFRGHLNPSYINRKKPADWFRTACR